MKTCVFVGPTLPRRTIEEALPAAELLPPVQAGSVYAALRSGYCCLAIIDGFFEQVPTVWHKEILFALSRGARVYGSSSMGALRAAELHPYGMVGIGKIFEAYRSGVLEDDDEVAVVHSPAEDDFRELSTAMVNIRFGLQRAREQGLITAASHDRLVSYAKRRFYAERSWPALFADARSGAEIDQNEISTLQQWIWEVRPNQKREDAELLLRYVAKDVAEDSELLPPSFAFESTSLWELAVLNFDAALNPDPHTTPAGDPSNSGT